MSLLLRFFGTVAAVILVIHFVPGVSTSGAWQTILLIAFAWSVISLTVKPVIHLFALPITMLTLGLFSLIINALLFWLMAAIVPGFYVSGFIPALFGSALLAIFSGIIHALVKPRRA